VTPKPSWFGVELKTLEDMESWQTAEMDLPVLHTALSLLRDVECLYTAPAKDWGSTSANLDVLSRLEIKVKSIVKEISDRILCLEAVMDDDPSGKIDFVPVLSEPRDYAILSNLRMMNSREHELRPRHPGVKAVNLASLDESRAEELTSVVPDLIPRPFYLRPVVCMHTGEVIPVHRYPGAESLHNSVGPQGNFQFLAVPADLRLSGDRFKPTLDECPHCTAMGISFLRWILAPACDVDFHNAEVELTEAMKSISQRYPRRAGQGTLAKEGGFEAFWDGEGEDSLAILREVVRVLFVELQICLTFDIQWLVP